MSWRWPGCWRSGSRSSTLAPDFLTEFVLYALSATNLTMLVALVFVLARNIIKLVVERRRALPFARFRAKLVAVLLGMTLIPAVLVLIVGSELIRNSVDRWFNAPMDEVLSSANAIAGDYYQQQQRLVVGAGPAVRARARRASTWRRVRPAIRDLVAPDVAAGAHRSRRGLSRRRTADGRSQVAPVVDVASPVDAARATHARRPIASPSARAAAAPKRAIVEQLGDRRRSDSHGGADPLVAERAGRWRRRRQRLPDRPVRGARARG